MRTDTPPMTRLADYRPPEFQIDQVRLEFDLHPSATRVKARMVVRRDGDHTEPLRLDGDGLKTLSVSIDGAVLPPKAYVLDESSLAIPGVPDAFVLETEVEIDPSANSALMGLYMSGGRFCSQCEPEGFRRITWYADRPDVMSRFTVRIEAPKTFQRLLSNGNLIDSGDLPGERHFALWEDPFRKPSYLFALVAGELDVLEDSFVTMSGRTVALRIYVDPGMAPRALYAMDSLKRAMRWDEETYGREYDLDLFMIVAVRDFNFGAMENKGLNVFVSQLVLADPATATDLDYERIEGVVAHEYFHNWTGNRITCRDWFQLCLKEGLTVFRDQSFSADMRGHAVQRIKEVRTLRALQFSDDAGPMAHPVRPEAYAKIDNFYTSTIYEKGAELIRMLKLMIGDEAYRKGMDLYFERWDGCATTIDAFIACFADATGRDFSDFFVWYGQAGTPVVKVEARYDAAAKAVDLTLSQSTAPTPGQPTKRAVPMPIAIGLLDDDGREQRATEVIVLSGAEQVVRFEGVARAPVLSALRGFSAPVNLRTNAAPGDAYVLLAADPDLVNRWEAGQSLARDLILVRAAGSADTAGETRFAQALGRALRDQASAPAFKALLLALPSETDLAVIRSPADPAAIHAARDALRACIATELRADLRALYEGLRDTGPFSADAEAAGRRSLRNAALDMLTAAPDEAILDLARAHFGSATNMTDSMGGLGALVILGGEALDEALTDFYGRWKDEPLVIDKWFQVQARDPSPQALDRMVRLIQHPAFDPRTPTRFRSVVGAFPAANPARFHDPSGAGYRFIADQVLKIDAINPVLASRMVEPLGAWGRYIPALGQRMRGELERIAKSNQLSNNVREQVAKALG